MLVEVYPMMDASKAAEVSLKPHNLFSMKVGLITCFCDRFISPYHGIVENPEIRIPETLKPETQNPCARKPKP
jgi:hypothetical protein